MHAHTHKHTSKTLADGKKAKLQLLVWPLVVEHPQQFVINAHVYLLLQTELECVRDFDSMVIISIMQWSHWSAPNSHYIYIIY